jgi:hypothetical protein
MKTPQPLLKSGFAAVPTNVLLSQDHRPEVLATFLTKANVKHGAYCIVNLKNVFIIAGSAGLHPELTFFAMVNIEIVEKILSGDSKPTSYPPIVSLPKGLLSSDILLSGWYDFYAVSINWEEKINLGQTLETKYRLLELEKRNVN